MKTYALFQLKYYLNSLLTEQNYLQILKQYRKKSDNRMSEPLILLAWVRRLENFMEYAHF